MTTGVRSNNFEQATTADEVLVNEGSTTKRMPDADATLVSNALSASTVHASTTFGFHLEVLQATVADALLNISIRQAVVTCGASSLSGASSQRNSVPTDGTPKLIYGPVVSAEPMRYVASETHGVGQSNSGSTESADLGQPIRIGGEVSAPARSSTIYMTALFSVYLTTEERESWTAFLRNVYFKRHSITV
jgi:hypothetical protein